MRMLDHVALHKPQGTCHEAQCLCHTKADRLLIHEATADGKHVSGPVGSSVLTFLFLPPDTKVWQAPVGEYFSLIITYLVFCK